MANCKPNQPSQNPLANTDPTNSRPRPDADETLFGAIYEERTRYDSSGRPYRVYVERATPPPPSSRSDIGQLYDLGERWESEVGYATQAELANPSTAAAQSYSDITSRVQTITGFGVHTGARKNYVEVDPGDLSRQQKKQEGEYLNQPLLGGTRTYADVGADLAGGIRGGRTSAARMYNVLNGDSFSVLNRTEKEFLGIAGFSEVGRGYGHDFLGLKTQLLRIAELKNDSSAQSAWRDIGRWFPPARPQYASSTYGSGPSTRPDQAIPGIARPFPTRDRDPIIVDAAPRPTTHSSSTHTSTHTSTHRRPRHHSRHHHSSGSSHRRRHRRDDSFGLHDPNLVTDTATDAATDTATNTDTNTTTSANPDLATLAGQHSALNGNPDAQKQLLDNAQRDLAKPHTLRDGSTVKVLAANWHTDTASRDNLKTLESLKHGYLKGFNRNQQGVENPNCTDVAQRVDHFEKTGVVTVAAPTSRPAKMSEMEAKFPGKEFRPAGKSMADMIEVASRLDNGGTAIVAYRVGPKGTAGHVINVHRDHQGVLVFKDGQVGELAFMPRISSNGAVYVMDTSDPSAAPATSSTEGATSSNIDGDTNAGNDADLTSVVDTATEQSVPVITDYAPTQAPFTDVAPAAVAKSTEQTPTEGDPIDVTTGRMLMTHTDVTLPGLTLERTYRSDYRWGRTFGSGWASTLDQRIIVDGDTARFLAADGSVLTYSVPAEGETALPLAGQALRLLRLVGGGWTLTDPSSGRMLLFVAANSTESLLTDVVDGGLRWSIVRDRRGVPMRLVSSTGALIAFGSSSGMVTTLLLTGDDGEFEVSAQFGYDADLNLIEVTNSSNYPERFQYADGRIVRWQDRNGEWYTYTYDEAGRCVLTDGKGGFLRYQFDYQPGRTVVTDSLGAVRTYELNDRLQVIAEIDATGATTRSEWDAADRLLSRTDPLGRTMYNEYGRDGQLTAVIRPDGSRSSISYDDRGRATSWMDFDGRTRSREFGEDGRITVEHDSAGEVAQFPLADEPNVVKTGSTLVRRTQDHLVASYQEGDAETRFEYDALGRVRSVENEAGITYLGWTLEGELAWRDNSDGTTEEFEYDAEGNLVEMLGRDGRVTYYQYGAFDMLTAKADEDGNITRYTYDTELRLRTIVNPEGQTWSYAYDANGRVEEETDFEGRTQRYRYDAAGQLVEHVKASGEVTTFSYDLLGRVIERRTGDAVTGFAYDAAGRVIAARNDDADIALERDATGRVVSETVNGNTVATTYSEKFGAVTVRTRPSGAATQWSYDESGRPQVLVAGGHQLHFAYADGREVSRAWEGLAIQPEKVPDEALADPEPSEDVRYTLDGLGRPVTRVDSRGEFQFTWDHDDRLNWVVTPDGDRWYYRYDAFGRRIAKQRVGAKGVVLDEVQFVWSGDLLVEQHHRDSANAVSTTAWEYHPSAAHPVAEVANGVVQQVSADLRAGGRYLDEETGLQYDRSRFYDPAAGRFLPGPSTAPAPAPAN